MSPLRKISNAFSLSGALLLGGCGGVVQTYDGPKRNANEMAILKTGVGELTFHTVWVDRVDEATLVRAYSEVEVAPGRHSLRVQLSGGIVKASTNISFEARAGRVYRLQGTIGRGGAIAWIEDERTGEIVAGDRP